MSDLDALKNKMDEQEEQARIAEEQRTSFAERIKTRTGHRLDYVMNWRIVNFFIAPEIKSYPPFTPALNEYSEYLLKCTRGGIRVDVDQHLSQRINNTNDPEKLAFYNTMLTYMNTPMITSFVEKKEKQTERNKFNAFVMDDSISSPDPSFYGNPDTTQVLQVIWHTPENQKFLDYVRERQEAFERGAENLRVISNDLKVLITQFENSVLNNSPVGQVKRMSLSLIDMNSAEVMELLQSSADRPTVQPETDLPAEPEQQQMAILEDSFYDGQPEWDGVIDNEQKLDMTDEWEPIVPRTRNINPIAAQQLPNQEPSRHVVQHILDHVQEKPVDICNTGKPNKDPEGSTKNVVPCVSGVVDTIISVSDSEDDLVTEDAFEEEEVLTGEKAVNGADYTSTQTITAAPKLVDLEINKVVPVVDNQQKLAIGVGETPSDYEDSLVLAPGEQMQDSIECELQSVTTNAPTKYDDLLVIPPEEFYERVPWMHYIVSEVKWNRRWCSMSDLDALKNKMEKEAEEKADQEEQARIAGEQRVLIAERIEERAGHRLVYLMNWKVSHFFILADNKDCPPFTPALMEYSDYSRKCTKGGIRVDVGQYLSQRINNTNDPEKLAFYNTMLNYKNTPMITSFVQFMCNKWKTGKTFKSKENAFLNELQQWINSLWKMQRSEYLAHRRRGGSPKWTLESSYDQYLNIECPKYYDTDFFKARMQFHLLNDNNDPISDFLGLHYAVLDGQQIDDEILDRDFYFIAKECASLKEGLILVEKAFFTHQLNILN